MLSDSKKTIYAMIDALVEETGDKVYLSVHRATELHGFSALPVLVWVAEVRTGDVRGRNYPVFACDGEQNLRVAGCTEDEALAKLAALCCLVEA